MKLKRGMGWGIVKNIIPDRDVEVKMKTKDSGLEEILKSGWVIRKSHIPHCRGYTILSRDGEEMVYDSIERKIVSFYKV